MRTWRLSPSENAKVPSQYSHWKGRRFSCTLRICSCNFASLTSAFVLVPVIVRWVRVNNVTYMLVQISTIEKACIAYFADVWSRVGLQPVRCELVTWCKLAIAVRTLNRARTRWASRTSRGPSSTTGSSASCGAPTPPRRRCEVWARRWSTIMVDEVIDAKATEATFIPHPAPVLTTGRHFARFGLREVWEGD